MDRVTIRQKKTGRPVRFELTDQTRMAIDERIGRKLVEHHPTGYRLTELGRFLLPHAIDVERSVEAFQRQVTSADEELTGTLQVTCPEGWHRACSLR